MTSRFSACGIMLGVFLVAAPASAQVIRGTVRTAGSHEPLVGGLVVLLDESGARRANAPWRERTADSCFGPGSRDDTGSSSR
ncbi:MAG TPA: hypothetical protein VF188_09550 [Longimicrobiales bacterium]